MPILNIHLFKFFFFFYPGCNCIHYYNHHLQYIIKIRCSSSCLSSFIFSRKRSLHPHLCTIVAGPVQWGIALVVCKDRECFHWLGSMQQASQYPNVSTRCCQVDWCAAFTILHQEVGAMLKQGLHTFFVASHCLQPEMVNVSVINVDCIILNDDAL